MGRTIAIHAELDGNRRGERVFNGEEEAAMALRYNTKTVTTEDTE